MNAKEQVSVISGKSSSEKEDMINYCLNLLILSPPESPEHKIAQLALIQLREEQNEIISLCQEIKKNTSSDSIQHKITEMVMSQYKNVENNQKSNIIPEGWQLVPKDPSLYEYEMFKFVPGMARMKVSSDEYDRDGKNQRNATWIYKSMLKNAPEFNIGKNKI